MKKYAFGVDIGGTTVKMGFFSIRGELLDKWEIPTDTSEDGKHIIPDIAKAVREKLEQEQISPDEVKGIGMGVPGPVDSQGNVIKCVNLGWGIFNLEQAMKEATGFVCKAGNDANVATLGEMYKGGGEGYQNLVMLTLGTGVGGGVILDGKIVPGAFGAAGEIGHFPMVEGETAVCGCGKTGCLEQYASANGISRVAKLHLENCSDPTVLREVPEINSKEIFDAAKSGDAVALELVDGLGKILGRACAMISCVVDPDIIIIGGGVSRAGSIVTETIAKHYVNYAFHASRNTRFGLAKLGNDAGIYGGFKLILDENAEE